MRVNDSDSSDDTLPTREEMLKKLADIVDLTTNKLKNGRIRDATNEKVRISWGRVATQAISAYLAGLREEETDDEVVREAIIYSRKIIDENNPSHPDLR